MKAKNCQSSPYTFSCTPSFGSHLLLFPFSFPEMDLLVNDFILLNITNHIHNKNDEKLAKACCS